MGVSLISSASRAFLRWVLPSPSDRKSSGSCLVSSSFRSDFDKGELEFRLLRFVSWSAACSAFRFGWNCLGCFLRLLVWWGLGFWELLREIIGPVSLLAGNVDSARLVVGDWASSAFAWRSLIKAWISLCRNMAICSSESVRFTPSW